MLTAAQMEMATYSFDDAFGPPFPVVNIAGVDCAVLRNADGLVEIVDDRGAIHEYRGVSWEAIKGSMEAYFQIFEVGL